MFIIIKHNCVSLYCLLSLDLNSNKTIFCSEEQKDESRVKTYKQKSDGLIHFIFILLVQYYKLTDLF